MRAGMAQAGPAIVGAESPRSGTGVMPWGIGVAAVETAEIALQRVAAGILGGVPPQQFMDSIYSAGQQLGNRAFLRWVREWQGEGRGQAMRSLPGEVTGEAVPVAASPVMVSGPLQLMPKKRRKKVAPEAPETQQEAQPGTGAAVMPGAQATPEAPAVPKKAATPAQGQASETTGAVEKKKKKKSRVQVALNILRSENVQAFGRYIEAEIAETELLHNLCERINRAQDLAGVSNAALRVIDEHMRRLDPDAVPREEQAAEMPVPAPVKTELTRREAELFAACAGGDVSWTRRLLKLTVDVNMANQSGTPLGMAVLYGYTGIVRELLSKPGIDVNLATKDELTPLYLAAVLGHAAIVGLLLDARGINVNLAAPDGTTPLCIAAFHGYEEVVRLLLAAPNINVNARGGFNGAPALFFAAQQGQEEIVKLLLAARGINVNLAVSNGSTPLLISSYKGHDKVVKLLLAAPDIEVNARRDNGATALHIAAEYGFPVIIDLLIKRGADVNQPMYPGTSPLCTAIHYGRVDVVRMLLQAPGIRVNQTIVDGTTPLGIAARQGHRDIVRRLLRKGADPNLVSTNGIGPLHVACLYGHTAIVQMLINKQADSNLRITTSGGESCTLYDLAQLGNNREVIAVLTAHRQAQAAVARLGTLSPCLRPAEPAPLLTTAGAGSAKAGGQALEDEPGPTTPPSPSPESLPSAAATAGAQTEQQPSPVHTVSDSQPAAETLSPLAPGKQALVRDILRKLDRDTLEPLEGIRMMMDVKRVDSLDGVCAIYNRLAGIERQRERARRRGVRHGWLAISTSTPAPAPEGADPRFALDAASELDAEGVEVEIRRHLAQRYHRFVGQAVNNMEFGRGKPTTGFPGLWHVSAGVPGVGSCSVFYYTDGTGKRIRVVGVGHHVGPAVYRLDYAAGELGGVGRVLCIA